MSTYYVGDNPWLRFDVFRKTVRDEQIAGVPQFYRGTDWWINVAAFWDSTTLVDVGSWGHLYLSLYPGLEVVKASEIWMKTITTSTAWQDGDGTIFTDCTLETWLNRTKKQAEFYCVDSTTGGSIIPAAGNYTLVFHGDNTNGTLLFVLGITPIKIIEAGL